MADLILEYLDIFHEIVKLTDNIETAGNAKKTCQKINELAKKALDLEE